MERVYLVQSIYNTDKKGDSIIDNYIFDSEKKAKIYFNLNIELTIFIASTPLHLTIEIAPVPTAVDTAQIVELSMTKTPLLVRIIAHFS